MSRRPTRTPTDNELEDIQRELAALTLRLAALTESRDNDEEPFDRPLRRGDRVQFHIVGQGYSAGEIIRVTPRRVQILQDRTGNVISRAPHNTTRII